MNNVITNAYANFVITSFVPDKRNFFAMVFSSIMTDSIGLVRGKCMRRDYNYFFEICEKYLPFDEVLGNFETL